MSTALVYVEGVLGEHSVLHGFYPLPDGVRLAHALSQSYRLVFATVQADEAAVEHWLLINGMTRPAFYAELIPRRREWADLGDAMLRAEQASCLRREGYDLGLVVAGDPSTILLVTELGVASLLFTNPSYRWADFRPDRKRLPRPWEEIDQEVTRQRELKATDPRLREEEVEKI
jgi:hypothetical protein